MDEISPWKVILTCPSSTANRTLIVIQYQRRRKLHFSNKLLKRNWILKCRWVLQFGACSGFEYLHIWFKVSLHRGAQDNLRPRHIITATKYKGKFALCQPGVKRWTIPETAYSETNSINTATTATATTTTTTTTTTATAATTTTNTPITTKTSTAVNNILYTCVVHPYGY